jgi:hypothetical protein
MINFNHFFIQPAPGRTDKSLFKWVTTPDKRKQTAQPPHSTRTVKNLHVEVIP